MSPSDRRGRVDPDEWLPRVARVIAVAFLTGDPDPPAMAARAGEAIGDRRGDWLDELAEELAAMVPALVDQGSDPVSILALAILRSDTFTYVERSTREDWWAGDEHLALAETLGDADPELRDTLEQDEPPDRRPWLDDLVRSAPTEVPAGLWTRRAAVRRLPPDDGRERDEPTTDDGRRRSRPASAAPAWAVPPIDDIVALAEWFGLHPQHLRWYADVRSMERDAPAEPLRHYTYRWIPKRHGGARLLESPKPVLRFFQRRILHDILDHVPAHPAAHGFRPGRSVHSFAVPHEGSEVVIRLDLEAFFTSVHASRAFGIFRTAGYPAPVAHLLTGMVTNTVPVAVRRVAPRPPVGAIDANRRTLQMLGRPHLPQGAPTSPAIANLAAFGLDRRLAGLARSSGATYTRYADDLAFSGSHRLGRHAGRFVDRVGRIVLAEGFAVNHAKTRVLHRSERQAIAGMVVNERAQVSRRELDHLRAVLHDAAVNGPAAANRDDHPDFRSHLLGRIGWVATGNPARAARLQARYDAITW